MREASTRAEDSASNAWHNFIKVERYWEKNEIYQKLRVKNREGKREKMWRVSDFTAPFVPRREKKGLRRDQRTN